MRRDGGVRALRRYLRIPRQREVFLVHHGQENLHRVARETGITDITVGATASREADAATEMALALGANRLDFTIDEPAVSDADGNRLGEVTVDEAALLARDRALRPRIRSKLRAACEALQLGMWKVRIGDPVALSRDQATVVVPISEARAQVANRPPDPGYGPRRVSLAPS
jgi:hypothetical protein